MRQKKMNQQKGFSSILVMIMLAFLSLISISVLHILTQEARLSKLGATTIAGYAGAEGIMEYALLKIKNHEAGFQDQIKINKNPLQAFQEEDTQTDRDAYLLKKDKSNPVFRGTQIVWYKIHARTSKNPVGTYTYNTNKEERPIPGGKIEVIPLFYDSGEKLIYPDGSYKPKLTTLFDDNRRKQISNFTLQAQEKDLTWILMGTENSSTEETHSMGGTLKAKQELTQNNEGNIRKFSGIETMTLGQFLSVYKNVYLILYNSDPNKENSAHYVLTSGKPFSLPYYSITASSRIGEFVQNIEFKQEKSEIAEMFQYLTYQ